MGLGKIFKLGFDNWRKPIIFFGVSALIFIISEEKSSSISFKNAICYLLLFSLLLLFISTIYQLNKGRGREGFITGLLLFITIILLGIYSISLSSDYIESPFYGDLKVPDNIILHLPKGSKDGITRPDSILNIKRTTTDFELYNSLKPGDFEYDFWIGKIEAGTIFLKAFEITSNEPLTAYELPNRTSLVIYNPIASIKRFETKWIFSIYEGQWGKPFGARFEVWYKPLKGGQEIKLLEKSYRLEGW